MPIDLAADVAAIYSDPVFSVLVTRSRVLVDDVDFRAFIGTEDVGALDGHALAARRQIAYAAGPDVRDGDTLTVTGVGAMARYSGTYRAIEPRAACDGMECRCTLQLISSP